MSPLILVNTDGPVATVTLNRPEQRNAISYEMWREIGAAASRLSEDKAVRCVVFKGAGDMAFSAGADIKDFPKHRYDSKSAARYAEAAESAMEAVERMPQPTLALVRGYCVGGGLELASCTDIRVASEGSKFGLPVQKIGVVAGYQEVRRIIRIAGLSATAYLIYGGRLIGHDEALRCGLVTLLVPEQQLEEETYRLAAEVARGSPVAHADHKAILRKALEDPALATLSEEERALQFRIFDSEDFREGSRAFIDKRPPRFPGR
ncbi:MAG: enoyl-CoA hydratase/isomerase family protein [Dehalococcoidia bacterium]|nr:enoyl-CoA hydratase/isomerase family protein [Dehalococcoidia bacterium]